MNSSRTSDEDATLIEQIQPGLQAGVGALEGLMKGPENFGEIADLLGQDG